MESLAMFLCLDVARELAETSREAIPAGFGNRTGRFRGGPPPSMPESRTR